MLKCLFMSLGIFVAIHTLFLLIMSIRWPGQDNTDRWVALVAQSQFGNQLWDIASAYGIAQARGARFCLVIGPDNRYVKYSHYIEWTIEPPSDCPGFVLVPPFFWVMPLFTPINNAGLYATYNEFVIKSPAPRIRVDGNLQSFRYFDRVHPIPFRLRMTRLARRWVAERNLTAAIHVRRGDKVWDYGNVVPPVHYFRLAIALLNTLAPPRQKPHRFVVATDDPGWVKAQPVFSGMLVLNSEDLSFDMAVISECQHKILSIGTFGWWGAYLNDPGNNATNTVIYPLPQMESRLAWGFNNSDYFPSHWTSIEYRSIPDLTV